MFRHFPKRIARNVGDYDCRSAICGRPTRASTRSNGQPFHLLPPSFRKTRARHRIQMSPIGAKQQNRSKSAAAVFFNNQAQRIQDLIERNAGGDHFQETLFTSEQRFSALAFADVYSGAVITVDFARLPEDGSAHTVDVLNRSVRKCDSKFEVESLFLVNCLIETSLNKRSIFRMNRFQE